MKLHRWQVFLGISLVVLSAALYCFHYVVFHDAHHIFLYMVGDVAFVPIEVLLVSLIIHSLLSRREKRIVLEKLNMVIGAFFSEAGTMLLATFSDSDPGLGSIRKEMIVSNDWSDKEFEIVSQHLRSYNYGIDIAKVDFENLRTFLLTKRDFMVRLLENPALLEHETFTDLLRAVFHLTEEIQSRGDLAVLPDSDCQHLAGDIRRAYVLLVGEWLDYMRHLKNNYPYLFSLAMRTNPFDQEASPVVK
ncbi:MAG: hypothetical protein ABIJ00_04965 [Candidatus Eisenbacteria bacterium]